MTNKDKVTLMRIIKRCNRVSEDVVKYGESFEAFETDNTFRDSVSMNIMQIGEISNDLSKEFKERTKQEIPWRKVYDMRNHFAHDYDSMDDEMTWNTAFGCSRFAGIL